MAVEFTDANFEELVIKSDKPVIVDLWAAWCGPCLMMAPILDSLAVSYAGRLKIAKIDMDANPTIGAKLGCRASRRCSST